METYYLEQRFKEEVMEIYEKVLIAGRSIRESINIVYWKIFNEVCSSYVLNYYEENDEVGLYGVHDLIEDDIKEYVKGIREFPTRVPIDIPKLLKDPGFTEGIRAKVEFGRIGYLYVWNEIIVGIILFKTKPDIILYVKDRGEAEEFIRKVSIKRCRKERNNAYTFLVKTEGGIDERTLEFSSQKISLSENYNDDLPWKEMMKFVKEDIEGLAILHGPAGTGKTTLLKKLIQENPGKEFVLINSKDLENPDNEGYLEYFLENKNRVYILEDCERLLLSRNQGGGSNQLATLLNMTDGLLGSTLQTRFICTFNTDLRNIDDALLRKGRLRLKYFVGPLCLEKTRKKMGDSEVDREMTLAEIYYDKEDNDFSKLQQKRIGF